MQQDPMAFELILWNHFRNACEWAH